MTGAVLTPQCFYNIFVHIFILYVFRTQCENVFGYCALSFSYWRHYGSQFCPERAYIMEIGEERGIFFLNESITGHSFVHASQKRSVFSQRAWSME